MKTPSRQYLFPMKLAIFFLTFAITGCQSNSSEVPVKINILTSTPKVAQEEAIPTDDGATSTITIPVPGATLDVDIKAEIVQCSCDGKAKKVDVNLVVKNGVPPYYVNAVKLNSSGARFEAIPGSKLKLTVKSSDGLIWEGEILVPNTCEPPPSCGKESDGNDNLPSTYSPPTSQPPTKSPPTSQPPTDSPPTSQPPTKSPPTSQPPTDSPPTPCPTKPGKPGRPDCK